MFEQVYASTWHHPVLFWALGAPWLLYFGHRWLSGEPRFLRAAVVLFQIEILADAWLTSKWSPLPESTAVAITFVVLGDLRYFVLLERFSFADRLSRWAVSALALSFAVPVLSIPVQRWLSGNAFFLAYELTFFVLAAVIRFAVLPRRSLDADVRRWLERLTLFEMVQYAAWAAADVIILSGADVGYLVRLLPNTLYYAAFVPFAWLTAPREIRS